MRPPKHPNSIVEPYTTDLSEAFGASLVSIILYGSAASHEFRPGISPITLLVTLSEISADRLETAHVLTHRWLKRGLSTPVFSTKSELIGMRMTHPIDLIAMESSYRVWFGDDVLAGHSLISPGLHVSCLRELRTMSLLLRSVIVSTKASSSSFTTVLQGVVQGLVPVIKALLVMNGRSIPHSTADVIGVAEGLFHLGTSDLARFLDPGPRKNHRESGLLLVGLIETMYEATEAFLDAGR